MFQVGFGDCFLLSFDYASALGDGRKDRHLLIDFGSTDWPEGHKGRYTHIVDSVADRTGGRLDAIVVTHRHRDHLSGFGDDAAATKLAAMRPSVVLRPWTEDPEISETATAPPHLGAGSMQLAGGLSLGQGFAEQVWARLHQARREAGRGASGARGQLEHMAFDQLKNQKAIKRIDRLAEDAPLEPAFLHAGQSAGLASLLPGVKVSVLGPPTVEQWSAVAKQRDEDPVEFWLNRRGLLEQMLDETAARYEVEAAAIEREKVAPGPARWVIDRMHDQLAHSLLRIVRTLDDALNNTSLVLLFETGDRKLLFPGDAQIENWSYSLDKRKRAVRRKLGAVDLYKVGHHGSRNATPKQSLVLDLWSNRRNPLASLMSTMPGVHGESEATAVPRGSLVTALADLGQLFRTDWPRTSEIVGESLSPGDLFMDVTGKATGHAPFERMP